MWRCPRCGHRFVSRNLAHSCVNCRLADHFEGKDPAIRKLFDAFVAVLRRCGPVTVYAQQTRIICMRDVRFAGAVPRRRWLDCALLLTRDASHPALRRIEVIPPMYHVHHFRVTSAAEFDEQFGALAQEAYAVGCREHLRHK